MLWDILHIELRRWNRVSYDHRSYECNLCNCVEKPETFSAFKAKLVRALHRSREVTGSNPVEVLNFSFLYTQLHTEIAFLTAMITAYLLMIFSVMSCSLSNSKRKTWKIQAWTGLEPWPLRWGRSAPPVVVLSLTVKFGPDRAKADKSAKLCKQIPWDMSIKSEMGAQGKQTSCYRVKWEILFIIGLLCLVTTLVS